VRGAPPCLGADCREVLARFGVDQARVEELITAKAAQV